MKRGSKDGAKDGKDGDESLTPGNWNLPIPTLVGRPSPVFLLQSRWLLTCSPPLELMMLRQFPMLTVGETLYARLS